MASDTEKYIIKLQEPLLRKALRYSLWGVITLGALFLLSFGLYLLGRAFVDIPRLSAIEDLAECSPLKATYQAEIEYNRNRTAESRLAFIRILIKAGNWQLADYLMDSLRPCSGLKQKAYDLIISSHAAPESVEKLLPSFKDEPQTEEEILVLGEVAIEVPDKALRAKAHHWLKSVESPLLKDKAALLLAELFAQDGQPSQCRDIASRLWDKPLSTSDSMQLLRLCKKMQLSGYQDYQSTLKIYARKNAVLALALACELSKDEEPQKIADWLLSLPRGVSSSRGVTLKISELLAKAGRREEAVLALKKDANELSALLSEVVYDKELSCKNKGIADLVDAAQYAQDLTNSRSQKQLISCINTTSPGLWSLQVSYGLVEKQGDEPVIISLAATLDKAFGNNLLLEAQSAYWQLVSYNCDAKPLYEMLKQAVNRYPVRRDVELSMALAHYRLGNLTDALNVLPQDPATPREKLVCAYLWAKAREFNKAGPIIGQIETPRLSPSEKALYGNTLTLLQADAPLERWIKLLK